MIDIEDSHGYFKPGQMYLWAEELRDRLVGDGMNRSEAEKFGLVLHHVIEDHRSDDETAPMRKAIHVALTRLGYSEAAGIVWTKDETQEWLDDQWQRSILHMYARGLGMGS